jgi:hypothetical protein
VSHILSQDAAVKEEQAAKGLVLRRGRHAIVDGEVGQEASDLIGSHASGMAVGVMTDETPDPVQVGPLGAAAVVRRPQDAADLVEESQPLLRGAGERGGTRQAGDAGGGGVEVTLGEGRRGEGFEGRRTRCPAPRDDPSRRLGTLGHGAWRRKAP